MKPMDVDLEDMGLHETDNSKLSASTASNSTLLQLEATDAEKAQNEEETKKRKAVRKSKKRSKRKEEKGAAKA